MNALVQEAQGIAQGLKDAAEATNDIPLCSRLEQAADDIERLARAFPEDGLPEGVKEIIDGERERLTDAECVLKMMHGAFSGNLGCDICCNAESAAKLMIQLLAGVNDALDSINIRKAIQAEEDQS